MATPPIVWPQPPVVWLLIVIGCVAGCHPMQFPRHLPNPCPQYPNLLIAVMDRVQRPEQMNTSEELERQLCLQAWVRMIQANPD